MGDDAEIADEFRFHVGELGKYNNRFLNVAPRRRQGHGSPSIDLSEADRYPIPIVSARLVRGCSTEDLDEDRSTCPDKTALILGVANQRSLAWAIASVSRSGGLPNGVYLSERTGAVTRSRALVAAYEGSPLIARAMSLEPDQRSSERCGVRETSNAKTSASSSYLIHSIAFARREELEGDFRSTTSLEGWRLAQEIQRLLVRRPDQSGRCR